MITRHSLAILTQIQAQRQPQVLVQQTGQYPVVHIQIQHRPQMHFQHSGQHPVVQIQIQLQLDQSLQLLMRVVILNAIVTVIVISI